MGFGSVGRRFVELLPGPYARALRTHGRKPVLTGIATARHGIAIDAKGLAPRKCLATVRSGRSLDRLHRDGRPVLSSLEFVRRVVADVVVEVTPLDPRRGEPATSYVRAALRRGLDVVTANKGPVAFARRALLREAGRKGALFLHEGAVMDGTPVFNLVARCLPGARVTSFRGTLNSTTTRILAAMERGSSAAAALGEAQALGIAEADPSFDLLGWDAAVKVCALANTLWDAELRPTEVRRRGIAGVTANEVRKAMRSGLRVRLVARADERRGRVRASVAPARVPVGDPLAGEAADAALVFTTDLAGEIGVVQRGGTVDETAYALLSDLMEVARARA